MTKTWKCWLVGAVGWFIAGWLGSALAVMYMLGKYWSYWPADSSSLASWVQAIGTIGAIAAAYYLGERQSISALHTARLVAKEAEMQKLEAYLALCLTAKIRAQKIGTIFDSTEYPNIRLYTEYDPSILDGMHGAISAIPVHELGSPAMVIAVLDLRDQLIFLKKSIERFQLGPDKKEISDPKGQENSRRQLARNVIVHVNLIAKHHDNFWGYVNLIRAPENQQPL